MSKLQYYEMAPCHLSRQGWRALGQIWRQLMAARVRQGGQQAEVTEEARTSIQVAKTAAANTSRRRGTRMASRHVWMPCWVPGILDRVGQRADTVGAVRELPKDQKGTAIT